MKILVCSDSHSGLSFMRRAIRAVKPDAVIHLGDYYDDGQTAALEYPNLPFHQVPGNCDRYSCPPGAAQVLFYEIGGVRLYMTHGHLHGVKMGIGKLLADAKSRGAQAALYGHTHRADCRREPDGMWVLNPGSCQSFGGTVGLLETANNQIISCRILTDADLEVDK